MQREFHFRQMQSSDGVAFTALAQMSPDTGQVGTHTHYQLDAYQVLSLRDGDTAGVVAETPEYQGLVGAGLIGFSQCCFEGELLDYALLHSLMVHLDYRRQGLATELAQWRLRAALETLGNEGLVVASIQQGNVGSLATARKWCQQLAGEVQGSMARMRTKPPAPIDGVTVRPVQPAELEELVHQQNQFYEGYNFYKPDTPASLAAWLAQTPFATPFRHSYVAVDTHGNILAGLVLIEQHRLVTMQIDRLPMFARLLNKFLSLVPPDGTLKQLTVNRIWYAPGQLPAARHLWEAVRWEWRDRGSGLLCFFDPRGPLPAMLRLPIWMPRSKFTFAVHSPKPMTEDCLVYL